MSLNPAEPTAIVPAVAPALMPVQEAQPGVAVSPNRHGKLRIVTFEMNCGDAAIQAAIETVKAALAR